MIKFFTIVLVLLLSATPFQTLAAPRAAKQCTDLFKGPSEKPLAQALEDMDLDEPEVEAKLLVPDSVNFKSLKDLVGKKLQLLDADGNRIAYQVEFNKEHIYEDTYFDVKKGDELLLFAQNAVLRQRKRYDRNEGEKKFTARYVNIQAKDGTTRNLGLNESIYARNEIRGDKTDDFEEFQDKIEKRMSDKKKSKDRAIRFARELVASKKPFQPVLSVYQERYFMKISPVGKKNDGAPSFYLSLDKVNYKALIGEKNKASERLVEIEVIDDLSQTSAKEAAKKLYLLDVLTTQIQDKYRLIASPDDKYASGVRKTILKSN